MLTGVVVFIHPEDAAQIAVTIVITLAFFVVSEVVLPYDSSTGTWISRSGHIVVFISFCIALVAKVDVSSERESSQNAFGGVLVALNIGLFVRFMFFGIISSRTLDTSDVVVPCKRLLPGSCGRRQ